MYHSIFFGDKNTWDDWHIIPTSRPVLKPPVQKKYYLDIPGADGSLDLSESLTGYPVYNDREGSFEFLIMNDFKPWNVLYSEILEYLHGQTMRMILEDDNQYFYEGRFEVEEWQSTVPRSTIVIKYKVGPYKWNINKTTDDWLWDPFSLKYGKIQPAVFRDISINSDEWVLKEFDKRMVEGAPVCPEFIVSSIDGFGIDVRYVNGKLGIDKEVRLNDGRTTIPDFILYGQSTYQFYFAGNGNISIDFRSGRL